MGSTTIDVFIKHFIFELKLSGVARHQIWNGAALRTFINPIGWKNVPGKEWRLELRLYNANKKVSDNRSNFNDNFFHSLHEKRFVICFTLVGARDTFTKNVLMCRGPARLRSARSQLSHLHDAQLIAPLAATQPSLKPILTLICGDRPSPQIFVDIEQSLLMISCQDSAVAVNKHSETTGKWKSKSVVLRNYRLKFVTLICGWEPSADLLIKNRFDGRFKWLLSTRESLARSPFASIIIQWIKPIVPRKWWIVLEAAPFSRMQL